MSKKIFRSLVIISFLLMILCLVSVLFVFTSYIDKSTQGRLEDDAHIVNTGLSHLKAQGERIEYLQNLKDINRRITYIDKTGQVLFDSGSSMSVKENHLNREEIRQALEEGQGYSTRYSDTLSKKTLYYAVKSDDGSVLRISITEESVIAVLYDNLIVLLFIWLVIMAVAIVLSRKLTGKIVKPLEKIDMDTFEMEEDFEELNPLLVRLHDQKENLMGKKEELEARKRELESIVENLKEGFILIDKNGKILNINHQAIDFLCESERERSDSFNWLSQISRNEILTDNLNIALSGIRKDFNLKIKGRYLFVTIVPLEVQDGGEKGAMMSIIDISDVVKREKYRREFTSNVSHELKTPLTSISGFAEIMQTGNVPKEDMIRFSKTIYKESRRMTDLVSDILTLSKLDEEVINGKADEDGGRKEPLSEVISSAVDDLRFIAEECGVKVETKLNDDDISVPYESVYAIVYNLVENAIKYRDINKVENKVSIFAVEKDGKRGFAVKDNGVGIASEHLDRIFERFYRVDKGRSSSAQGTGLGLSIVKKQAMLSSAELNVNSRLGYGTEIEVLFNE